MFFGQVCDTYGSSSYFVEQTLFLLTSVSNTIPNVEPILTSAENYTMLEDEGQCHSTPVSVCLSVCVSLCAEQ